MEKDKIIEGIEAMKVFDSTRSKVERAGLIIPEKPLDANNKTNLFTEWTQMKSKYGGIGNIPFNELGEFLDRWTALISYTRWVEAVADIEQQSAREIRDTVKKQLYVNQDGNREMKDALVHTDDTFISLEKDYNEKLALYVAIKGLREGYETRSNAISREITRRTQDTGDLRRGGNRGGA